MNKLRLLLSGFGYVNTVAILWAVQLGWIEHSWAVAGMWLYCFLMAVGAISLKTKQPT